jgi:hypothetical protein
MLARPAQAADQEVFVLSLQGGDGLFKPVPFSPQLFDLPPEDLVFGRAAKQGPARFPLDGRDHNLGKRHDDNGESDKGQNRIHDQNHALDHATALADATPNLRSFVIVLPPEGG